MNIQYRPLRVEVIVSEKDYKKDDRSHARGIQIKEDVIRKVCNTKSKDITDLFQIEKMVKKYLKKYPKK